MPLRKSVQTLEELCFKVVAENVDNNNLRVSDLPIIFINKLYENRRELKIKNPLSTTVFMNLSTTKLESIDEFGLPLNQMLRDIQTLCKNLTHLNLYNMMTIGYKQLSTLVTHLPKLQHINLRLTRCTNGVLKAIGDNCNNLCHLDVSYSSVSSAGIRQLCATNRAIQVLKIEETSITTKDCLYVLDTLENLKEFTNSRWRKIFSNLKVDFESKRTLPTGILNLQVMSSERYKVAFSSGYLTWLRTFTKLRKLALINVREDTQTYSDLPGRLIDVISDWCPNLETFCLISCTIGNFTRSEKKSTALFQRLRKMVLLSCNSVNDELVLLILSAPNLQQLVLSEVNSLTNDFLSTVLASNGLQQLRVLQTAYSQANFRAGMTKLLRAKSPLSELDISNCSCINEEDFTALQTYVRIENLDMNITRCGRFMENSKIVQIE